MSGSPGKTPVQSGPCAHAKRARVKFTPANPRICRHRVEHGPWQNSPALGCGGGIRLSQLVFARASARICAHRAPAVARICAHFPSKIFSNLSKNPVNLSEFIVFFRNSGLSNAPGRFDILGEFSSGPVTAIAGRCALPAALSHHGKRFASSTAPRRSVLRRCRVKRSGRSRKNRLD